MMEKQTEAMTDVIVLVLFILKKFNRKYQAGVNTGGTKYELMEESSNHKRSSARMLEILFGSLE